MDLTQLLIGIHKDAGAVPTDPITNFPPLFLLPL